MVALLHPEHAPADVGNQQLERPRLRLVGGLDSPPDGRSQHGSSVVGASSVVATSAGSRPGNRALVALGVLVLMLFVVLRVAQGTPPAASWDGLADSAYGPGVDGPAVAAPTGTDRVHVVEPGDTLWALALELRPSADPRPIVDALADRNGGPAIRVGQRLVIPAAVLAD